MQTYQFSAMGTEWSIMVDGSAVEESEDHKTKPVANEVWLQLVASSARFEQRFSRFIEGSEATAFRTAQPGAYPISSQFAELLKNAAYLREISKGAFDPAIGTLFELAGYDNQYRFHPDETQVQQWQVPGWKLDETHEQLVIEAPVVFDVGGTAKGYWIDQLSKQLTAAGYPHHLVEGGGDMMATTKASGEPWSVALEWPGKPDTALGVVELRNQGLAVSDVFRRRWGEWHHIVNVSAKQPVQHLLGCVAVADSAWQADQLTSVLSFLKPSEYEAAAHSIRGEYVALLSNGEAHISPKWSGRLF